MKKDTKRRLIVLGCFLFAVLIAAGVIVYSFLDTRPSTKITLEEAQAVVDKTFANLYTSTADGAKYAIENMKVTVNDIEYGYEKDVILSCSFSALNIGKVVSDNKQELLDESYRYYIAERNAGKMASATKVSQHIAGKMKELLNSLEPVTGETTLYLYETGNKAFTLYLDTATVDLCTGGLITAKNAISDMVEVNYNGEVINVTNNNSIRRGINDTISLKNFDSTKPATGNAIRKWCLKFAYDFNRNFIQDNRWVYLLEGLRTTLAITVVAGLMGIVLGFLVAIVRCTNETTGKFYIVDRICRLYLTIIRGTPVMVQLLIIYFVMLLPLGVPKFISAVLCFGLNSGAYVAEIVRGGIMSIDKGQSEAGRSLGFNYAQTMLHFVIPQAFKAALPSLANEFITLLKESSVAFYIGVADLTQGGLKIRSVTYSNFMPLIAVALIYLVIVLILTKLVGILERRLRKSEH